MWPVAMMGQTEHISEQEAKKAVYNIVKYSGLLPNFVVRENTDIANAVAFIKDRKRYIEYNPEAMAGLLDSTQTDWAVISILAHEIAHHLLGHTLNPRSINPGDELSCDRYSGYVLERMGATLEEAISAIQVAGTAQGTKTHPPRTARIEAIRQGWTESRDQMDHVVDGFETVPLDYEYRLRFEGDENLYYIDSENHVLWFNFFAEPIIFGTLVESESKSYWYEIQWEGQKFFVDSHLNLWSMTAYNVLMIVGALEVVE